MSSGFLGKLKKIGQDLSENKDVYIDAVKDAAKGVANTVGEVVEDAKTKREENIKKNLAERLEKCPRCGGELMDVKDAGDNVFYACENQGECLVILDADGREDENKELKDGLVVDVAPVEKDVVNETDTENPKEEASGKKDTPK